VSIKPDKFTWIVLGIVVALLVAAVVTVNLTGAREDVPLNYQTTDQPDTPVVNAFIAQQRGDAFTAREQYSTRVLGEIEKMEGYDPFTAGGRPSGDQSQRLRILTTDIKPDNPDQATVTFEVDTYSSGGPFGSGNTWTSRRTVPVVREDGVWKIDGQEFFY
jgi:hypothetical protein